MCKLQASRQEDATPICPEKFERLVAAVASDPVLMITMEASIANGETPTEIACICPTGPGEAPRKWLGRVVLGPKKTCGSPE